MTPRLPLLLAVVAALGACGMVDRLPGLGGARIAPLPGTAALEVQAEGRETLQFARAASRDGIDSFAAADGRTVALRSGLIVSAKGYPEALMAAEVWQSARLIRAGQSGTVERFHSYLTGNDKTEVRTFACTIAPEGAEQLALGGAMRATLLMGESCTSLTGSFKNQYWIDPHSGAILQSRQWIGPLTGTLRTRPLPGGGGSP